MSRSPSQCMHADIGITDFHKLCEYHRQFHGVLAVQTVDLYIYIDKYGRGREESKISTIQTFILQITAYQIDSLEAAFYHEVM